MSQFFWSAEDYAVGDVPDDFWRVDLGVLAIEIKQDVNGLKYMEVSGPDKERAFLSVIGAGADVENAEIWARFMSTDSGSNFSFSQRATGVTDSLTIYDLRMTYQDAANQNKLEYYSSAPDPAANDSTIVIGSKTLASQTLVPGTNVLAEQRGLVNLQDIKGKWWAAADPEPAAWSLEGTQSTINGAGRAGIFSFRPYSYRIYAYGLGTNGDPAPTTTVATGPVTPINLTTTNIMPTSARLGWE